MKELRAKIISHALIFGITIFVAFYGWWEFGNYFCGLVVFVACLASDIIEQLCNGESEGFATTALFGHIVYWLILAYILRGYWKPFGGLFG